MRYSILLLLVAAAAIVGFAVAPIVTHGDVSPAAGFGLGAVLGAIGLVLVAMLKRRSHALSSPAQINESSRVRTVSDGRFRLWLVARSDVQNDGLPWNSPRREKQFWSRKAALAYARQQEREAPILTPKDSAAETR